MWIDRNTIKCDVCGREHPIRWTTAAKLEVLPDNVKHTYDRLGIPEAERTYVVTVRAAARELRWKSVGGTHYCPDCA